MFQGLGFVHTAMTEQWPNILGYFFLHIPSMSTQAPKNKKVSENNGQLRFRPSPRMEHASRLDQKISEIGDISFYQHFQE